VPGVTVVIPVWDEYVHVLARAVDSVLAQPIRVALLVIDNASDLPLPLLPDGVAVCRLPRRVTVGSARNTGLGLVSTELAMFLDADDLLAPGTLPALLSPMAEEPSTVAVCGRVLAVNERTGASLRLDFPSQRTRALARVPVLLALHAAVVNRLPTTGCLLVRVAAARDAGGFGDSDYAEDWPLNLGLSFRGRIRFVDHDGRVFRPHARSLRSRLRTRAEVDDAFARVRERIRTDPRAPRVLRLSLPVLRLLHGGAVRRLTPGGVSGLGPVLRLIGDGQVLAGVAPGTADLPSEVGR
jgi:glycosyltransferase involved in cell wall biosynthesis